jgi:mannose-6-phosphate isomerase-like protein (cupin superfamily)
MTEQGAETLEPAVVRTDEGEARWWFEALAVIQATTDDTGGQMTIVEVTEPPGHDAPLHVHHREDEAFYILEGSATIHVGDASFDVGPGDYAFGPRDIPHRYSVGPDGCRMLFICTPGGFEKPGPGDERAGGEAHAAAALRRGPRLGARRRDRPGERLRATRVRGMAMTFTGALASWLGRAAAIALPVLALGMIATSVAFAAPKSVASCQALDQPGTYELAADVSTIDTTCIEITASDVQLDLAGHTMSCAGSGFAGSCQVAAFGVAAGVEVVPGLTGVKVRGPGLITGFDDGVEIVGSDVQVKDLTITGPVCASSDCSRPVSQGLIVLGRLVDGIPQSGPVDVSLSGNSISGFARGIGLLGTQCPLGDSECVLSGNQVEGSTGEQICIGINLAATTGYTLVRNVARANGSPPPCFPPTGITLNAGSTNNTVAKNDSSNNNGFGISAGPGTSGNTFVNNTARANAMIDLQGFPGTTNLWSDNNRCNTGGGAVPPTVCNPGE